MRDEVLYRRGAKGPPPIRRGEDSFGDLDALLDDAERLEKGKEGGPRRKQDP